MSNYQIDLNRPPPVFRGRPKDKKWRGFLDALDKLRLETGWNTIRLRDDQSIHYARIKARKAGFLTAFDQQTERLWLLGMHN